MLAQAGTGPFPDPKMCPAWKRSRSSLYSVFFARIRPKMAITRHLIVSGRVQGVGFRQFMVSAAHALNVTGWVRNRADGSVEATISGTPEAVHTMIERARRGPAHAAVTDLRVDEAQGTFERFDLLPTV